ncbi:MAG: hypothetical protein IJN84_08785 [Clostridia bacterium]|nr:hypothetical protein [Clostridia bacterium]
MNKCKMYCSNYNCPWNSCYQACESEKCSNDVMYEVCSCARFVDIPMNIVSGSNITTQEFREDAIDLLKDIAQAVECIAENLGGCEDNCNNGCGNGCNGCNGFNAYDTTSTPCGYTRTSGNYPCRRCGRCR